MFCIVQRNASRREKQRRQNGRKKEKQSLTAKNSIGTARQGDPISNLPRIIVTDDTNDTTSSSIKNNTDNNNSTSENKLAVSEAQDTKKESGEPDVQPTGQQMTERFDPSAPEYTPVKFP